MLLGVPPVVAGLILALLAALLLFAEVIGKVAVAIIEVTWDAIRPHRVARHA